MMNTDWGKDTTLTKEEAENLLNDCRNGDQQARELLIKNNMGLVIFIAKRYFAGIPNKSASLFEDLVQSGTLALIKTIDTLPPDTTNLAGYASFNIMQEIIITIEKNDYSSVSMNRTNFAELNNYQKKVAELIKQGKTISNELLKNELGWGNAKIKRVKKMSKAVQRLSSENINYLVYNQPNIAEKISQDELKSKLDDNLVDLNPREELVLRLRYGFSLGKRALKYSEISLVMNLNEKMIKVIEERALYKLRKMDWSSSIGA